MITGKQRSYLKSLAHHEEPIVFIGKEGLTENIIDEMDRALGKRELVKAKIQETAELKPAEVASELADKLNAEFVQAIGRKFTLYRQATEDENRKIVLPR